MEAKNNAPLFACIWILRIIYPIKNWIKKENKPAILMTDLNDREFSLTIDALTNKRYHEENLNKYDLCNLPMVFQKYQA